MDKLLSLFVVISLLGLCHALPFESRILGGTNTTDGEYPFMVSIRIALNNHFCQGSILTTRTILTAAGCIGWIPIERVEAVVGTNLLNSGGERYRASELIVHPDFNPETFENDIGLYITIKEMVYSPVVRPITISPSLVAAPVKARFLAWGRTSTIHNLHNNLLYIDLDVITNANCQGAFGNATAISDSQLCTYKAIGEGGCTRDYGAPLVYNSSVIALYSYGVTVNETQCAVGFPDVFTRISSYAAWINANQV